MNTRCNALTILRFAILLVVPTAAHSQDTGLVDDSAPVVSVQAQISVKNDGRLGELSVTATFRDGYHIYATSQRKPFLATKIEIEPSSQIELLGLFQASRPPHIQRHKSIDVDLHEYEGNITWTAPLKVTEGVNPSGLIITGQVVAQACYDQGCLPPKQYAFTAQYKSPPVSDNMATAESTIGTKADEQSHGAAPSMPGSDTRLDFNKLDADGTSTASLPLYVVLPMALAAGFILNFIVPTVTFIIGLGAACWWIGRLSVSTSGRKKARIWIQGAGVAALVGFVSFGWLHGIMNDRFERAVDRVAASRNVSVNVAAAMGRHNGNELPWQPYSHELLAKYTAAGKTVFVDFTADWCLTCKANEAAAINKKATKQLLKANDVITLKADKTQPAPEVDELLKRLGNKAGSIPFYAVFPAGNPNKPILLDGMFTSPQPILDVLKKAGPSRQSDAQQASAILSKNSVISLDLPESRS